MKKSKYHIFYSWILLLCFAAGQYMVYAHQHNTVKGATKAYSASRDRSQTIVQEKCGLCDVMHHNVMVIGSLLYFNHIVVAGHVFKQVAYSFKSIQLILSGGRAPPQSSYKS